ncbi:MAG: GTPase, partial [Planctomycetota bacterium]
MISDSSIETEDTILAISTPPRPAQRGAVRLSGPDTMSVVERMGVAPRSRSPHQVDVEVDLGDPLGTVPIRGLLWPGRASYTGQPSAELHTYGCLPLLKSLLDLGIRSGGRMARPGEFTLRAFLAGRLDLTQAEAVLGVIDAEQRGALDYALRQLGGNLSKPLEALRSELLDLLADVEAGLDFVDEDIQFISDDSLRQRLETISSTIAVTRHQLVDRDPGRSRIVVALRGLPNAGKSQLLNALVGNDVAIVAGIAGTTRDVVSVPVQIAGFEFELMDTAGIEEDRGGDDVLDHIARQAQQQSERAGRDADVRLWCVDASQEDAIAVARRLQASASGKRRSAFDLFVTTKNDQAAANAFPDPWVHTSAILHQEHPEKSGIENLKQRLAELIHLRDEGESNSVIGTSARCAGSLENAERCLTAAMKCIDSMTGHEFVAAEIRVAISAIGEVTGAVY